MAGWFRYRSIISRFKQSGVNIPVASGVALALVSCGLFVVVGVLVRQISEQISLFQVLLFRQLVFIALLLPAMRFAETGWYKTQRPALNLLRIFAAFLALYFGFVTVSNIPLADATALGFVQVLLVALISAVVLKEVIGLQRCACILLGFVGVLLVVQPTFSNSPVIYIVAGLVGALGAAVAVVCVRFLAQSESRLVLLSYQAVFVALLALIPAWSAWQTPTVSQLMVLISIGAISSLAQWIGVTAYKYAPANLVANVEYVKILYSLMLGYWLFAEIPNALALVGATIILASGLLALLPRQSTRSGSLQR